MRASRFEFKMRMVILVAMIALGYWSPWIEGWHIGSRMTVLEWLALTVSRTGLLPFTAATPAVIVLAMLIAAAGAAMRVWGTAYLGAGTVNHMQMQSGALMADGPYRFVRNPLYLGSAFTFVAMSFVMPVSGAILALSLLFFFMFRLILGEEAFLRETLGAPYEAYCNAAPRIFPLIRTALLPAGSHPQWMTGLLAEISAIGVFVAYAGFSWHYDHWMVVRAILISFGLSLVVRAVLPQRPGGSTAAA